MVKWNSFKVKDELMHEKNSRDSARLVEGGIYRHYKGKLYRVHHLVRHSETLDELVYYETLYDNPAGRFWVRPHSMFLETVIVDGVSTPRFAYVGDEKGKNRV
jgi:hypothetical protein